MKVLDNQNFVVAYPQSNTALYFQIFDSTTAQIGSETLVSNSDPQVTILVLTNGNFALGFTTNGANMLLKYYTPSGSFVSGPHDITPTGLVGDAFSLNILSNGKILAVGASQSLQQRIGILVN